MTEFISTESFVSKAKLTTVWNKTITPTSTQYAIVSAMANRKHLIVSTIRQMGLTLTACLGARFLEEVMQLNPIILVRDETAKDQLISFSEKTVGFLPNIAVEGEIEDFSGYDVVIVEDFIFSSHKTTYAKLRKEGNNRLVLLNSHDKRSTVDSLTTLGGHFDHISLCDDTVRWDLVEQHITKDESGVDYFNLWTEDKADVE